MSPEFFTDEYKTFKYMSLSPEDAAYYKNMEAAASRLRPEGTDGSFKWKYRVEFPEQLIDLHKCDVWFIEFERAIIDTLVYPKRYNVDSHLIEIRKSVAHFGFPQRPGRFITQGDMPLSKVHGRGFLSSTSHYMNVGVESELITDTDPMICLDLWALPVFPWNGITDNAIFYNKEWAELYYKTVESALVNQARTISTISSYLLG